MPSIAGADSADHARERVLERGNRQQQQETSMKLNVCGRQTRAPAMRLGWALGIAALTGTAQAANDCASLTAVTTADATMTSAAIVTPPATIGGATVTVPL